MTIRPQLLIQTPVQDVVAEPETTGFFVLELEGRVVESNAAFRQFVGLSEESLSLDEVDCPSRLAEVSRFEWGQKLQLARLYGFAAPFEADFQNSVGVRVRAMVTMTALRDGTGSVACLAQPVERPVQPQDTGPFSFQEDADTLACLDMQFCYRSLNERYQAEFKARYGVEPQLGDSILDLLAHVPQEQACVVEQWGRALHGEIFSLFASAGSEASGPDWELCYGRLLENGQQIGAYQIGRPVIRPTSLNTLLPEGEKEGFAYPDTAASFKQQLNHPFEAAFELASVGIARIGSQGDFLHFNQKYCDILGYSREELFRLRFADITHPDDLACERALQGGLHNCKLDYSSQEKRYRRKDGSVVWVHLALVAIPNQDGETQYNLSILEDITDRKQAELALQESEERFRMLANASPAQIFDMAADGRLRFINQTAFDFFGPERAQEIKSGRWAADIHPDDVAKVSDVIHHSLETKSAYQVEIRCRRRDGAYRWFLSTTTPSFYSNGEFYGLIGYNMDITLLKEAEFALRESEQRFRIMANASPTHIYVEAPNSTVSFINQTAIDFFGPGAEDAFKAGNLKDYFHPDDLDKDRFAQLVENALKHRQGYRTEVRCMRWDGQYRWFLASAAPSFYPNGELYGIIGSAIDITDRKQAEIALQESEERFRIIADASPLQIYDVGPDGKLRYFNKTTLDFYGPENAEKLMDRGWLDFVHPDDQERLNKPIPHSAEMELVNKEEFRIRCRDGSYRWVMTYTSPSFYPNGELYGLIGSAIDITERKEMEQALRQSESRWREMANAVPLILWVCNAQGEVIFLNDRWYQYTGLTPMQSLGVAARETMHPDDRELAQAIGSINMELGEPFELEYRTRNALGEYRWHLTRAVPIKDTDGTVLSWYGSSVDIHDRRLMEQELSRARDIAEEANKKKSQFLANMSHELRTPLNAVIGFSEMLKKGLAGPLTEKQNDYVEHIASSGRHLLTMVSDILDISKAEAGRIELFLQYVELESFTKQLRELLTYSAEKSAVQLAFKIQPGLVGLVADPDRLKQIFLNLIGNAIKFNHEGGSVNVSLGRSADQQWVLCEIRDTGIGIPADKIEKLFTEFYQVDSSNARKYEGTGLGLALTKRLVELHHGTIIVESQEGVGSTFTFTLPLNIYAMNF